MSNFLNLDEYRKRTSLQVESKTTPPKETRHDSGHNCPKCKESMSCVNHGNITINKCDYCHGYWIKDGQLEYLCEHLTDHQLSQLSKIGKSKQKQKNYNNLFHFESKMKCPYCPKSLREIYFKLDHKIKLDICDRCQGVFYDADELRAIITIIKESNI